MKHVLTTGFLLLLLGSRASIATDHFLTIGGGYSPTGNQISIEKNVQFFQKMLSEMYSSDVPHDIYFSDGNNPGRDLQYQDPDVGIPRAQLLLARIFQQTRYLDLQYRSHEVAGIRGGTSRKNLDKWFSETGQTLTATDRLFIYVTAHGGRAIDKKTPKNTGLYLWNSERCQMHEFTVFLKKIPADVPIVTVMVQCYSGGFANVIFKEGNEKQGFTEAPRCGFFATVHNRVAAGCTPDINEDDYHEYSSYFWAALRGQTRTGKPIEIPDYDQDGGVSLVEAHAYAILTSPTIDIPVKTSDAFLRKYSKLNKRESSTTQKKARAAESKPTASEKNQPQQKVTAGSAQNCSADQTQDAEKLKNEEKPRDGDSAKDDASSEDRQSPALLSRDDKYAELIKHAPSTAAAIIDGLSKTLTLCGEDRARETQDLAKTILDEKKKLDGQSRKLSGELKKLTGEISKSVRNRWPEFANRWHPRVNEFLANEGQEIVRHIESHGSYKRFEAARQQIAGLSEKRFDLDRRWIKCQRLLRALENVALSANLSEVATPEVQERYRQLVELESSRFGESSPVPITAATAGEPKP